VDDDFDVCWSCSTARDGAGSTEFNPDLEGILGEETYRAQREAVRYENLVTVATFGHASEAHMARARLESQGITAFVMDELAGSVLGLLPARSEIRLQVGEKDAVRAYLLLSEVPHLRREASDGEADDARDADELDDDDDDDLRDEHLKE
jgi:hypothetical protein